MQKFFLIIFKIFLLAIIITTGAGATCGGNILLGDFIKSDIGENFGFIIWGIEILVILIFGIRFLFFSANSGNLKKLVITTLLIGLICGGIFLAVCGGINIF